MDNSRIHNSNDMSAFFNETWGLSANQSLVNMTIEDGRITDIQDLSELVYALMQSSMRMMQRQRLEELQQMFGGGQVRVMERQVDADTGEQRVTVKVHSQTKRELASDDAPVMFEGQQVNVEVDEEAASKVDMVASQLLFDLEMAIIQQKEASAEKPAERSRSQAAHSTDRQQDVRGSSSSASKANSEDRRRSNAVSSKSSQEKQVNEARDHQSKVKARDRQDSIKQEQVESLEENRARTKKSQRRGS